jgi:hypothetical protein
VIGTLLSIIVAGGWILFGLGILGAKPQAELKDQTMATSTTASEAMDIIKKHQKAHGALPDATVGNKLIVNKIDAWGNPLRYEVAEGIYTLRSAGPDKKMDTADDIPFKGGEKEIETELKIEGVDDGGPFFIPADEETKPAVPTKGE